MPGERSKEKDDPPTVMFLYKLVAGASSRSYGLNVARLAGLPEHVLRRAKEQSEGFERKMHTHAARRIFQLLSTSTSEDFQSDHFQGKFVGAWNEAKEIVNGW